MKNRFLLAALALALPALPARSQSYLAPEILFGHNPGLVNPGPDRNGGSYPPGWRLIMPQIIPATPVWTAVEPLPFPFQCFGQTVTAYKVSSSGVLTFSTAAVTPPSATATALPSAQVPDLSVCIWPQGFGNIATKTFGTAPHRQLWVGFNARWSVVLEETSNAIYVVNPAIPDYGDTWSIGVQRNATQAVQVPGSPQSPSLTPNRLYTDLTDDNYYYAFRPTPLPVADNEVIAHTLPPVADRRVPLVVGGTLRNLGSQPLTAYRVGYRADNGPVVLSPVLTHTPIASLDTASFRHPLAWQPPVRGTYRVRVWVSPAPGGAPDPYPLNDTLQATVLMADSTMRRTVALEGFSSSTCSTCGAGNINVRTVNRPLAGRFVETHYQQDFPGSGDPYNTPEASDRMRSYYNYNGGISATVVDGLRILSSASYQRSDFEQAAQRLATVRINAAYQVVGRTVRVMAQVRAFDQLPPNYELTMAITERQTRNNYQFYEPVFYNVFRKFFSGYSLSPSVLASGQSATFTQTYTFPTNNTIEHFDSLRVMVLVQHRLNHDLLQAAYATPSTTLLLGAGPAAAGPAFEVLPNPTTGATAVSFALAQPETVRLAVYDALGRCVSSPAPLALGAGSHTLPLSLHGHTAGLYLVRLSGRAGASSQRVLLE